MNKTCKTCSTSKAPAEFPAKSSNPDGLSDYCRACQAAERAARATSPKAATPAAPRVRTIRRADGRFILSKELGATFAALLNIIADGGLAPNLLFTGPSGCGKTEAAKELARLHGLEFTKVDAPAMTDPEVWFGTREIVVKDGAPMTVYNESAFVRSIQRPGITLIDEMNRVADAVRQILLPLFDGSRQVTNPLTGEIVVRHPENIVIMTGNIGLAFTGTYAVDPALLTRAITTKFTYLDEASEQRVVVERTGVADEIAALFVRFAAETRSRAANDEDFPPISTREVLTAAALAAAGLDPNVAIRQAVISAASADGGADSLQASLEFIWKGIKPEPVVPALDEDGNPLPEGAALPESDINAAIRAAIAQGGGPVA